MLESVFWRAAKLAPLCYVFMNQGSKEFASAMVCPTDGRIHGGRYLVLRWQKAESSMAERPIPRRPKMDCRRVMGVLYGTNSVIIHTHCRHIIPLEYKSHDQAAPGP
jgi:hypothetical protein